MSDNMVIDVQNVSKAYTLYAKPLDMLKEYLFGGVRHDLFWALRGVTFSVQSGQRVGIIGPNGAGKSTLLQIIAGNLQPSSGTVKVNGSISALLSLVPAWNNEQNGLENIRFNLLLKGCNASQIPILTENIVDFAELGSFIRHPVKTYSSGMSARLSFAIATAISPEILIVDEVLGAGDGYFAGKAVQRMKQMCDRGKALLFVSHSISAVQQMCDTAIWIESGNIRLMGPVDYVTAKYNEDMLRSDDESLRAGNIQRAENAIHLTDPYEIDTPDMVRLRLRTSENASLSAIHYIRDLRIDYNSDSESIVIPPDATDDALDSYMDAMGCGWGRLYSRNGVISRILMPRTGARKGGHILVKRPLAFVSKAWPIKIHWTGASDNPETDLVLEFIDMQEAIWKPLETISKESLVDGWTQFTAIGTLKPVDEKAKEKAVSIANERFISPVEITKVVVLNEAGPTTTIQERDPFSIHVHLFCTNADYPPFNVSLIIYRSDGVYTFWQPSDYDGQLDTTAARKVCVIFNFEQNFFSSGDYEITVNAMSPWHEDVVQSETEIFDRKIAVARFTVSREHSKLQFGAINYRAKVGLIKSSSKSNHNSHKETPNELLHAEDRYQ